MSIALYYLKLLPQIRETARACGYAVGLHGSLERDCDLILVPWTNQPQSAEEVIEAVRAAVHGYISQPQDEPRFPRQKPHGRLAWSIQLGAGAYLDVSVMPRC